MIENWFFVLAMLAVLLLPGPTNALLASSTHQYGFLKTLAFLPVKWLGYVYGIALWALFIHLFSPIWPALGWLLHIASVLYVLWLDFISGNVPIFNNMNSIICNCGNLSYSFPL